MGIPDAIMILFLAVTLYGCIRVVIRIRHYRYQHVSDHSQGELPSVSVCIAARNERHALAQCLENVLASDYEKMEVLVLDDGSNDDTSLIIKSFARAGVRFIAGKELTAGWVGKNHAYYTLSQEASGDILLFLDVDTLLEPHSISKLVEVWRTSQLNMLSVLPRREDGFRASALFGTLRYFWELLLSSKSRPSAASAIFMIGRKQFAAQIEQQPQMGIDIRIESALARIFHDSYRYIVGTKLLGIRYEKRWRSQVETAARVYYPIAGTNLASWLFAILIMAGCGFVGFMPAVVFDSSVALINIVGFIGVSALFGVYTAQTMGGGWWNVGLRSIIWPLLLVQELVLIINSNLQYKLNRVTWKGRILTEQPLNHSYRKIDE